MNGYGRDEGGEAEGDVTRRGMYEGREIIPCPFTPALTSLSTACTAPAGRSARPPAPQVDPGLEANNAAGEAAQGRGEGRDTREVRRVPIGGSRRPAESLRPNPGADRPPAPGLCLGMRLSAPTTGSGSRRRPSGVCSVGGFRGLSEGEASCSVGSGRNGAASGGVFEGKIVATVPAGG